MIKNKYLKLILNLHIQNCEIYNLYDFENMNMYLKINY